MTSYITGKIYLPKETFEDLCSENPSLQNIGILKHEETHLKSCKEMNLLQYLLKYLTNKNFRLQEELKAYKEQFKYLKKHDLKYDLENVARKLSGKQYFWLTSYEKAKLLLDQAWSEA
jgi:hypothetical protein